MNELNLEEFREKVIESFSAYRIIMGSEDWCDDGVRRANESKTIDELKIINDEIEKAWNQID